MKIKIVRDKITKEELINLAQDNYGDMVKAVVDIEKEIMAIGGEFHSDASVILVEQNGSNQEDIWGINIYPEKEKNEWLEFNSLINIKPLKNNRDVEIESEVIKDKIKNIINKLIE